jgi:hypothetical protein
MVIVIKKISEKRKLRLQWYSERDLFIDIWNTRPHVCELTWKKIKKPKAWCFAHLLAKGSWPEYRMKENNIALVYGIKEHYQVDRLTAWNKFIVREMIDSWFTSKYILQCLKEQLLEIERI